ncbi:MAG: 6-carboxytetrahydropterin synthase [Phycisphaerales bacterium]|nr:MAG: 6-carboxytetrahydropterin synthase [Phycisphaerales bacterium]
MIQLTREVRLSLENEAATVVGPGRGANTWAGWPAARTLSPYAVVRGTFRGEPDAQTGYLVDIRLIDEALRGAVLGTTQLVGRPLLDAVRGIWQSLEDRWLGPAELCELELLATPYLRYAVSGGEVAMVSVTQCFEFAASHRLACAEFSDAKNREIFGKCSNPNGHGHNYGLEVTVRVDPEADAEGREPFSLPRMEAAVQERVLDRFDHKHLNVDCPEFADVNPSVENIAMVIWGLLEGRILGGELENVRVWETAKTRADYKGEKK